MNTLGLLLDSEGIEMIRSGYLPLKVLPKECERGERGMNQCRCRLMAGHHLLAAIAVFILIVEGFPRSCLVGDRLSEPCMKSEQEGLAIRNC